MGAEYAIVAGRPASDEEWAAAATAVLGSGQVAQFHGGMREILDETPRAVLSWWPARIIENDRLLRQEPGMSPGRGGTWVDVCAIYGRESEARAIAERVADMTGGTVRERS